MCQFTISARAHVRRLYDGIMPVQKRRREMFMDLHARSFWARSKAGRTTYTEADEVDMRNQLVRREMQDNAERYRN